MDNKFIPVIKYWARADGLDTNELSKNINCVTDTKLTTSTYLDLICHYLYYLRANDQFS